MLLVCTLVHCVLEGHCNRPWCPCSNLAEERRALERGLLVPGEARLQRLVLVRAHEGDRADGAVAVQPQDSSTNLPYP